MLSSLLVSIHSNFIIDIYIYIYIYIYLYSNYFIAYNIYICVVDISDISSVEIVPTASKYDFILKIILIFYNIIIYIIILYSIYLYSI